MFSGKARTWGSAWADYDGDALPDLFVSRHFDDPKLYRNRGEGFTSVDDADLRVDGMDRHSCAWGEVNGDDKPDLYCIQGAQMGRGTGPNQLFIQREGGDFVDAARDYGARDRLGRGRSLNWIDFDSDRDLDLFIGNAPREEAPNVLLRNDRGRFRPARAGVEEVFSTSASAWSDWDRDGDDDLVVLQTSPRHGVAYENQGGSFRPVGLPTVTEAGWLSAAWGDFNGDRWPDLHLIAKSRSVILRNRRGTFRPVHRMRVRSGRSSAWIDADNDGDLDLYVVQGAGQDPPAGPQQRNFFLVKKKGGFVPRKHGSYRGSIEGSADGAAVADYDRDGRLDLFVGNGYEHVFANHNLLRNVSRAGNWAGVTLEGDAWNPFGFGAEIHVETATGDYWRQVNDGVVFRSQSEAGYIHLGLGQSVSARVEVLWPDGPRDCRELRHGERVILQQATSPCLR